MSFPFTREQFLEVFRSYNGAIGIAPLVLVTLAVVVISLSHSKQPWRHRVVAGILAFFWLWSGVVYHWGFFAAINRAATLFGALFVVEGLGLLNSGVRLDRFRIDPRATTTTGLGWLLVVYSIAIYPLLGWVFGHGYPSGPSFGAPCPITIFTLGIMLWTIPRIPLGLTLIPLTWAIIGSSAAVEFGIFEDFALGLSAIIVGSTLIRQRIAARHPSHGFRQA